MAWITTVHTSRYQKILCQLWIAAWWKWLFLNVCDMSLECQKVKPAQHSLIFHALLFLTGWVLKLFPCLLAYACTTTEGFVCSCKDTVECWFRTKLKPNVPVWCPSVQSSSGHSLSTFIAMVVLAKTFYFLLSSDFLSPILAGVLQFNEQQSLPNAFKLDCCIVLVLCCLWTWVWNKVFNSIQFIIEVCHNYRHVLQVSGSRVCVI